MQDDNLNLQAIIALSNVSQLNTSNLLKLKLQSYPDVKIR